MLLEQCMTFSNVIKLNALLSCNVVSPLTLTKPVTETVS